MDVSVQPSDTLYATLWEAQESGVLATIFHYDAGAVTTGWWPDDTWDEVNHLPSTQPLWRHTQACPSSAQAFLRHAARVQQLMASEEQGQDVIAALTADPPPVDRLTPLNEIITPINGNSYQLVSGRYWDDTHDTVRWTTELMAVGVNGTWTGPPIWAAQYAGHLIHDHDLIAQSVIQTCETAARDPQPDVLARVCQNASVGSWLNAVQTTATPASVPTETIGGSQPFAWVSAFSDQGVRLLTTMPQSDRPGLMRLRTLQDPPQTLWERAVNAQADYADLHERTAALVSAWGNDHPGESVTAALTRFWDGPRAASPAVPPPSAPSDPTPDRPPTFHYGAVNDHTWVLWRPLPQGPQLAYYRQHPLKPPVVFPSEEALQHALQTLSHEPITAAKHDAIPPAVQRQWDQAQTTMLHQVHPLQSESQTASPDVTAKPSLHVPHTVHFALMPDDQYAAWVAWPQAQGADQYRWLMDGRQRDRIAAQPLDQLKTLLTRLEQQHQWPHATLAQPPRSLLQRYADQRQVHIGTMKDGWTIAWHETADRNQPAFVRDGEHASDPLLSWLHPENAQNHCRQRGWTWQDCSAVDGRPPEAVEDAYLTLRHQNPQCIRPQDTLHFTATPEGIRTWIELPHKAPVWTPISGADISTVRQQWAEQAPGLPLTEKQPPPSLTLARLTHQPVHSAAPPVQTADDLTASPDLLLSQRKTT